MEKHYFVHGCRFFSMLGISSALLFRLFLGVVAASFLLFASTTSAAEKQDAARSKQEEEKQRIASEQPLREGAKAAKELRPGKSFKDCPGCPEMVMIPAGSFKMGSPSTEAGRFEEEGPQHTVTIGRAFALGKTPVTRGQFAIFVNATGYKTGDKCWMLDDKRHWSEQSNRNWRNPGFRQEDSHPVVCVNWNDAKAYAEWLAKKTGKNYRLPTEAEWEYAARARTTTARYWGDNPDQACNYANVGDQAVNAQKPVRVWEIHNCNDGYTYTAPVGSFKPNAFGLYDMIGNAWEWTEDCWNGNYNGAPSDGSAWTSGECGRRMLRGGSWFNASQDARSARRLRDVTTDRINLSGFRLAR